MSRICFVNGRYVAHHLASVSIDDRGLQFADSIYEVWSVFQGRLADCHGHLTRLERSLHELGMTKPCSDSVLIFHIKELIRRNKIKEGMVYLQVTRGTMRRDHAYIEGLKPNIIITAKPVNRQSLEEQASLGIKAISAPDTRWKRCDIKTTGLLANCLGKTKAKETGAKEVIFFDEDSFVTEGGSSNVYIVTKDKDIITRPLADNILPGITRQAVKKLCEDHQLRFIERAFSLEEAYCSEELFITAATALVMPVIRLDDRSISQAKPGPITMTLREAYIEKAMKESV